jgi:hypothetical protein
VRHVGRVPTEQGRIHLKQTKTICTTIHKLTCKMKKTYDYSFDVSVSLRIIFQHFVLLLQSLFPQITFHDSFLLFFGYIVFFARFKFHFTVSLKMNKRVSIRNWYKFVELTQNDLSQLCFTLYSSKIQYIFYRQIRDILLYSTHGTVTISMKPC